MHFWILLTSVFHVLFCKSGASGLIFLRQRPLNILKLFSCFLSVHPSFTFTHHLLLQDNSWLLFIFFLEYSHMYTTPNFLTTSAKPGATASQDSSYFLLILLLFFVFHWHFHTSYYYPSKSFLSKSLICPPPMYFSH